MSKRKRRDRASHASGTTPPVGSTRTVERRETTAARSSSTTSRAQRRTAPPPSFVEQATERIRQLGRGGLLAVAAVAVAAVLGIVYLTNQTQSAPLPPGEVRQVPPEPVVHYPPGRPLSYRHYPPASGPHYTSTVPWGVYQEEVDEGYWVHNLEHGGIALLYNCAEGCPEVQSQVEEAFKTFPPSKYGHVKMVVSPYSKMDHRIAVVAWGWILELDAFDREKVLQFYQTYVDRGPEDVP